MRHLVFRLGILLTFLQTIIGCCKSGSSQGTSPDIIEKLLLELPESAKTTTACFSLSGKAAACIVGGSKEQVISTGGTFAPMEDISSLQFVPGSETLSFIERNGHTSRLHVGHTLSEPFESIEKPIFTPDGTRFAFTAQRNGRVYVVVDGDEMGPFLGEYWFSFSQDGQSYALAAEALDGWWVITSDRRFGPYEIVWDVKYGPQGQLAFAFKREGVGYVQKGNDIIGSFRRTRGLKFGSTDQQFAFIGDENDKSVIVESETRTEVEGTVYEVGFYPDASFVAYSYDDGESVYVRVRDEVLGPYSSAGSLQPDPAGGSVHFRAIKDGRVYYYLRGIEHGPFYSITDIAFSRDGSRYAYVASFDGQAHLVVDGQSMGRYEDAWTPSFSEDGNRVQVGILKDSRLLWIECPVGAN